MAWPLSQDYNEAIQSPESSFSDAELRLTEAKCNAIGIPMPRSGNFADVYEMTAPSGKKWALKCFTRQVAGLRERYAAISAYLKQANLPFMVDFTYLEQGVKVKGQWYPALKMQWVEGFTFNEFVKEHADQPQYLELLSQIWLRLARRLREAKMAHADLQHGNVLLVPGAKATSLGVRLIDYDGMFVPALAQSKSGEVGHPAFQHPLRLRDGTYSADVDRFPHLVIYTALRCLMVGGRYLWNKYDNGDNLLFRQQDLEAPANSALFAELRKLSDSEAGKLVGALAQAARQPLEQTPLLDVVVTDKTAVTPRRKAVGAATSAMEEPSVESMFATATAGDGMEAAGPAHRRPIKKSNPWMWASAALVLVALGLAGAVFLMSRNEGKDPRHEVAVAPKSGTETPEKKAAEPGKKPESPIDPKPAPPIDPEPAPKIDPKVDPPPPVGQAALTLQGHTGPVQSVAFSPDGKRLVSGSLDQMLKLWDAQTGQVERTLPGRAGPVESVAFSPDGQRIVSGGGDNTVQIWEAQTGRLERTLAGHTNRVLSVAVSSDGKRIASASADRTVKLWEAQTGQEQRTIQGHATFVRSVAFSPDGQRLVTGGDDRLVKVWDVQTGQEQRTLQGHTAPVYGVNFSPDGQRLVSGSADQTVKVWEVRTGQPILSLTGHTKNVSSVAFSPDGKRIVSASADQTLKGWDAQTGQRIFSLEEHTSFVKCVAFSPDGKRIVSGSWDKTAKVWNLPETIAGKPDPVPEPRLAAGGEIRRFDAGKRTLFRGVAFSPDGRRVLAASLFDGVFLWDLANGQRLSHIPRTQTRLSDPLFLPDNRRVLFRTTDKTLTLWDVEKGQELRPFQGHTTTIRCLALSADGRRALSGAGGTVSGADGKPLLKNGKPVWEDCGVRVWDVETGQELRRFDKHADNVDHVSLSSDGRRAFSSSFRSQFLWNVDTGREIRRQDPFLCDKLAAHFDGRHVLFYSRDLSLSLRGLDANRLLHRIEKLPAPPGALALAPDGRYALTSERDHSLRLWKIATGKVVQRWEGHTGPVTGLTFSPNSRLALSASDDGTVRLWQVPGPEAK